MQTKALSILGLGFGLIAFAACGKDTPPPAPGIADPVMEPGATPEDRARYCTFRVGQESHEVMLSFLARELAGTWTHFPAGPHEGYRRKEFRLDMNSHVAAITDYQEIGHNVEDVSFRKACLSLPLPAQAGPYAGYRVLELVAANNEGTVAFLFRIDRDGGERDAPALLISDRVYLRYGADVPHPIADLLHSNDLHRVWTYRDRR